MNAAILALRPKKIELPDECEPTVSGILVSILKAAGQSWSNGGISTSHDEALLILPAGGPVRPRPDLPTIRIEQHIRGVLRAVVDGRVGHSMMGGCYVATSDSRFSELCETLLGYPFYGAVALHDRYES